MIGMRHRISAGALVVHEGKILLVRHYRANHHDFWACPGGGVEGDEELAATAEREVFEETGLKIRAGALAYIDELIDGGGRVVKFWFLGTYLSGAIDVTQNPAHGESVVDAAWFPLDALPQGHVFPEPLQTRFAEDLSGGFLSPVKLELRRAVV